ncbi:MULTISPECIES: thiolase C-terminal domain-containing protein [Sphingobium]|jgi:acetyl-CoA acetyltransferase|uniref:thiolase C-terminal domain-containing protein n=1 Tax=Sphingobium TaxID=165695 RepID=UPI000C4A8C5C|nr:MULTISPECIES: thiolase [Sphingobium]MBS49014.1 thiolase [Sphingobium sp.]MCC4256337.1 thiolase [Sphingobium lactosutens]HCW61959.1 thiolase [Sphingobium sp.]|tara:strand:- start:6714 stop:7931 length:1218 start_codon:yes stop_codon:yes gene_type:complete
MTWVNQDKCAIVGIGATDYYVRGKSWPRTINDMAGEAILKACEDAGISANQIDGIAYYSTAGAGYLDKFDTASLMETLGIPYVGFSATLTSGGGGCPGAIGLATAGLMNQDCTYTVTLMALQQLPQHRLGVVFGSSAPNPENSFLQPSGLVGPGHLMSVLARRHMHLYGTQPEAFKEIVQATRENALDRPKAVRRKPLSDEEYWNSPMLADPLRRLDFCLETDGAVAVITTTMDRARDCRHKPAVVHGVAHGGTREWGRAFAWMGMPDPDFASSGHKFVADRIWSQTGLTAKDMDVALIYDHFSSMVLMQLEDYGFCEKGEGSDYVLSGKIRYDKATRGGVNGGVPVNTHGGNLNEAYIIGMTHIVEGVEQVRGTTVNQVEDCEFALVTGGPASLPVSGLVLRRA